MAQLLKNWTRKNRNHSNPILFKKTTTKFFNRRKLHDWPESRLSGVKVCRSQGRQFLKLNTDGTFNFTKKRHTSSIWRKIWREKRTHCHPEKCLFAPRSRPIFHFETRIGWKISGDFWRKNGSSIYQTWRNRTNTYIGLSGARSFCTKRTRINKKSKCQITKSP